jgi:hypothetical protein
MFRSADFPACAALVPAAAGFNRQQVTALPSIWQQLHAADQLHGGVVAEPNPSGPESILAYGLTVFLEDAFLDAYLASPRPHLAAVVYEQIVAGRSPVVGAKKIPAMNAAGTLNLVILHFGMEAQAPTTERARAAVTIVQSGFRVSHLGFCVKSIVQEAYGVEQLPFFLGGGFLLKSDYASYYAAHGIEPPSNGVRPYLMGLFSYDPESRYPGKAVTDLFQAASPRFYFSPSERRVLQHAVMDESDATIADALGVSHDAVKKVWRRVFERVAAADADLLGRLQDADRTRGKEKRRPLIQYLRYHLEELRPFARNPSTAASASSSRDRRRPSPLRVRR